MGDIWPLQDNVSLQGFCARVNPPNIAPPDLHYLHYCNTFARLMGIIRPPLDLPFVYYTLYNIGNGNIIDFGAATPRAWELARTVVAPPSSVVKCLWGVFAWGFGVVFLSCVCRCRCRGCCSLLVCVCVCVTCFFYGNIV